MITRRTLLAAAAGALTAPAFAQGTNWPDHNVRLVVPFPAGGSTDLLFRILAEKLKERFNQSFIVENRPGAGGNVGIDVVAKSPPDGYTIGGATISQFSINQYLYSRMPYDSERDIMAPSLTYELPNVAVVSAKHVQAKTLGEFIAWAKARPEGITIGSPGPGTTPHLSGVLFEARTGIKAVHVPFKGAAQTIPAMLSGDVNFAVDNLASYISQIESGNMRALAVTSSQRWPTLPECADHGGGRRAGFRHHLMGGLRDAERHAARGHRQTVRRTARSGQGPGDAAALPDRGRAHSRRHAGGGRRVCRQGARAVEGAGPDRRPATDVTIGRYPLTFKSGAISCRQARSDSSAIAQVAFWNIAHFLARHPDYRQIPFTQILVLQRAVARGKYCCLSEGKDIKAVATWQDINQEKLKRDYPNYMVDAADQLDGVLITSVAATDPAGLKTMMAHLNKTLADTDVYWDRHAGKGLEHRPPSK